jgi:AraC-like DNA-binding protein
VLEKDTGQPCEISMTDFRRNGDDIETNVKRYGAPPNSLPKQFSRYFPNRRSSVTSAYYGAVSFGQPMNILIQPESLKGSRGSSAKKSNRIYEQHLTVREFSLGPGAEWEPRLSGWTLIQIGEGAGYCLQPELNQELETGMVLLIAGGMQGVIRASHLSRLSFSLFSVIPARLAGLLTLSEQSFFQMAASRKESSLEIVPPEDPVAVQMKMLCANENKGSLLVRLQLFQLFVELFSKELDQPASNGAASDARGRLRTFLDETPSSDLLEMSFNELAQRTNCTSRHLSRIFRELVGISFRDKRAEIRLARARELLATSNSKVVDVALESGYKSLSLFNLMFSRRFGTSPGKWRQKHIGHLNKSPQRSSAETTSFFAAKKKM